MEDDRKSLEGRTSESAPSDPDRERREVERRIRDYQRQLRRLASELSLAEARERREIASDLHDHIGQALAFVAQKVSAIRRNSIFSGMDEEFSQVLSILEQAIRYTRNLTVELVSLTCNRPWVATAGRSLRPPGRGGLERRRDGRRCSELTPPGWTLTAWCLLALLGSPAFAGTLSDPDGGRAAGESGSSRGFQDSTSTGERRSDGERELEIVVVGVRPVATPGGASAVEVRPDSLHLSPAPTLGEVFQELPLLYMRTNSRGEAEISARGSESRQVAVLVDGVPMTLAWDARADASVIPATAPQELSYVRGLSSMLHGPNVLGGVIEIKVGQSLIQPQHATYVVTTGVDHVGASGGTARFTAPFVGAGGSWVLRGGAGFRDSPGQPLAAGVHERSRTDNGLRLNTDSRIADGFVSLRYVADNLAWCSFSGSSFSGRRGIAAELGIPDEDVRYWRYPRISRTLAVISGGTGDRLSPLGGYGDLEASVGLDVGRTDIDSYTSAAYSDLDAFENGRDRTLTLRLLGDQTLGRSADLRGAFTLADIRHDESLPEGTARYRQRLMSFGTETDVRLIERGARVNSCRLSVGAAWDVGETPEAGGKERLGRIDGWGGRVGLGVAVAGGAMRLHAGLSSRNRFPSLRELYSGALNRFAPNPDLKPERLVAMEGGVTARIASGELQAVLFHHQLRDAVVRIRLPEPDNRYMRVNRDKLVSTGVELFGSRRLGRLSLEGSLTAQSVDLTDTGSGASNRPENLPELFGAAALRSDIARGFRGAVVARYTGEQFTIDPVSGDDSRLAAGTRLDLEIARNWGPRLETTLAVDNVTDAAIYDLIGLPRPGRSVRLQLRLVGRAF
jgi:iron complex outermembrane receptor protein